MDFNGTTCRINPAGARAAGESRRRGRDLESKFISLRNPRPLLPWGFKFNPADPHGSYYENVKNSAEPNFNTLATSAEVASRSNPRRVLSLHFTPNPTNSSQVLDDSGKGNHGTITGAHFSEGKLGSALVFDGVNDYVAVEVRES